MLYASMKRSAIFTGIVLLAMLQVGMCSAKLPRAAELNLQSRRGDLLLPSYALHVSKKQEQQPQPKRYLIRSGDSFWLIAQQYGVALSALMEANPGLTPRALPVGKHLVIPGGKANPVKRMILRWPLGGRITSRFGQRWGRLHAGLDIAAPTGTLVRAAAAGQVVFAGWCSGYGLLVIVSHGTGIRTAYAHNSCLLIHAGQKVAAGEALSRVGATGHATGPHLHFEVQTKAGYSDPLKYLP